MMSLMTMKWMWKMVSKKQRDIKFWQFLTDLFYEYLGVKQPKKFSSEAFSDAMTKILASTLTGSDKRVSFDLSNLPRISQLKLLQQPILARSKGLERKLEDEKLDYKARKIMSAEKKALKEKGRIIPDFTSFEYEKRLRKVATRGVVKLFNAIRTQQKVTEVAVQNASDTRKTLSAIEKAKNGKLRYV